MNVRSSSLLRMADEARRPTRWWLAWLVVTVVVVAARPVGLAVGNAVLGSPSTTNPSYPYVAGFGSAVAVLALWGWVRWKEQRSLASVGFRPWRGGVRLLVGFGTGGAMATVGAAVGLLVGAYGTGPSRPAVTGAHALLPLLWLALLCVFQAGCQAALVPGYLLQVSTRRLPIGTAVVTTSMLVAVLQTLNPLSMINLFLLAVFTALVALQQGSLWLAAGITSGWSWFRSGVLGLPVGGTPAPVAVFSVEPVSSSTSVLGGGPFGLEAGLIATAVFAVATVLAFVALRRTCASRQANRLP